MLTSTAYTERVSIAPEWMMLRVAKIAKAREARNFREAMAQLELEASSVLQGEAAAFPRLAELVPEDFVKALRAGNGSTLAPRERAAIVLIQADAGAGTPDNLEDWRLEAFLRLKWASLDWMLEGAADD